MPATLIINKKSPSLYHGFYINTNGNNSRLFFNSTDEAKRIAALLNEQKINFTGDETGKDFLTSLKAVKTKNGGSADALAEMDLEYAEMNKCPIVLKIKDISNLYEVTSMIPFTQISILDFYQLLQIAVTHKKSTLPSSDMFKQKLKENPSSAAVLILQKMSTLTHTPGILEVHQDFMAYALESGELTFNDFHQLAISSPAMQMALKNTAPASKTSREPVSETEKAMRELELNVSFGPTLKNTFESAASFSQASGEAAGEAEKAMNELDAALAEVINETFEVASCLADAGDQVATPFRKKS